MKINQSTYLKLIVALMLCTSLFAKDPGLNAFYQGDYKSSSEYYEARLKKDHNNEKIMYNRGTSALAEKDYETAQSMLRQSLSASDESQLAKSYYNLGQIALQQQDTEEALENFKKSMLYDPDDVDAKIMYEHLQQQMKQQQQQQQDQDQQNDQDEQNDQEKQDQEQEKQDQEQEEQQQDQQQDQQQEQKQDQQQESQLSEDDLKGEDLSKEQAKNILNAMKEDEKESMKKLILSQAKSKKIKRSKEW